MKIPQVIIFLFLCTTTIFSLANANEIEKRFIAAGLVDVSKIDPTIHVDLVNSDPAKNFFRENFYNGLSTAYLQREVATKLAKAQKILKSKRPSYSLQILDAARPRSISQAMYDKMKRTNFERFVANPAKGSMHNYGIAVDITIVDDAGDELDMGITPFRRSTVRLYWEYALKKLGKQLSPEQKSNRQLLAETMKQAGFLPLSFEWWHFNGMEKDLARKKYTIIE
nr:M15 family metallopeptidase [uncultured Desulfuromonas sp.]